MVQDLADIRGNCRGSSSWCRICRKNSGCWMLPVAVAKRPGNLRECCRLQAGVSERRALQAGHWSHWKFGLPSSSACRICRSEARNTGSGCSHYWNRGGLSRFGFRLLTCVQGRRSGNRTTLFAVMVCWGGQSSIIRSRCGWWYGIWSAA